MVSYMTASLLTMTAFLFTMNGSEPAYDRPGGVLVPTLACLAAPLGGAPEIFMAWGTRPMQIMQKSPANA